MTEKRSPTIFDWADLLIRMGFLVAAGVALGNDKPEYAIAFILFALYSLLSQRIENPVG